MDQARPPLDALVEASGLKIKRICAACDISQGTLRNWRLGIHAIPADKLPALARVLGVSIADVMGWQDEPLEKAA